MIENLETLLILARTGTMVEASTELRITQSAVSKRISSLERYYDRKLIQKKGRRVELTHHGRRLVDKIYPILSELRDLFIDEVTAKGQLVIGVSDAILSSWGPGIFHLVQPGELVDPDIMRWFAAAVVAAGAVWAGHGLKDMAVKEVRRSIAILELSSSLTLTHLPLVN